MTTLRKLFNFYNGIAEDYTRPNLGEFSVSKHFDILSYPRRLQPFRGMTAESVTDSKIGKMIVASNGLMYGVGTDPNNPNNGKLWYRQGYGANDVWASLASNQLSGAILRTTDYNFLVDYPDSGNVRKLFWASTNLLVTSDPAGGSSTSTQALTFTSISNGFVHPKDKRLYFGYQTSSATYIGRIASNASPFGDVNFTALQLPSQYRVVGVTDYGNYLAIGCTIANQYGYTGATDKISVVFLWDRDETLATLSEIISWGSGALKLLNNLKGTIVGISTMSAGYSGSIQDMDSIQISTWAGQTEPTLQKEFKATRLTSTAPSCEINERVNFVYRNRLYFSANIINGGTAPSYYGLWSFGLNKNGTYISTIERMATNDGSETGVLACAINGDFVAMCHTAVGTLTYTINGSSLGAIYLGTSVWESGINHGMDELEYSIDKSLTNVWLSYLPLPTDATVTLEYRVDSSANGAWTTIFTETGNGVTFTEFLDANGTPFTSGRNYEFRITSTGGAIILEGGYNILSKTTLIK